MRRGEVWWASLPPPTGSGPGFRRPVLVVQSNSFNQSRISTVVVAVITSNVALAEAPGNVRLGKAEAGLPRASVVNVSQLLTIDRVLLTLRVKALPSEAIARVDEGLRLVMGL
ncbi:MAG TPA: type II toxin-antitoxin system PemK/MazF family toxin [Chiayiivirga sp.]|nr:type II toxin-antitoxin system PemK/MazF family toxin [Chiayiivirga sp.]